MNKAARNRRASYDDYRQSFGEEYNRQVDADVAAYVEIYRRTNGKLDPDAIWAQIDAAKASPSDPLPVDRGTGGGER